jgi:hypothetical protein
MMPFMRLTIALSLVAAFAGACAGARPPAAQISNGQIEVSLYLPDAKKGFYRGTRFDWSGVICRLEYQGHNYFGQWFQKERDDVHDFVYEGADIVAGPNTAITGPVEEFFTNGKALGYDEAGPGGTYIKIGVGVLRKPGKDEYDHFRKDVLVDPGKWTVKRRRDSVEFTQTLNGPEGYGYVYRKTVRLVPGKPEMVLEHTLKNTGKKAIASSVYNHNFLALDQKPAGPGYSIAFPFDIQTKNPETGDLAEVRGKQIVYKKALTGTDRVMTLIEGFGDSASDYDFRIESTSAGVGMRVTGDRPLSRAMLWSIRAVVSVEPYIDIDIEPGAEFTWKQDYTFYKVGAM